MEKLRFSAVMPKLDDRVFYVSEGETIVHAQSEKHVVGTQKAENFECHLWHKEKYVVIKKGNAAWVCHPGCRHTNPWRLNEVSGAQFERKTWRLERG